MVIVIIGTNKTRPDTVDAIGDGCRATIFVTVMAAATMQTARATASKDTVHGG